MKKLKSLTIFFPCYNDALIMPYLLITAKTVAQRITDNFELLVINDGSTDTSAEVLSMMKTVIPELHIITHSENKGYGGALKSGFANATKEWVFYTDGDGQYDVKELVNLVEKITPSSDVINGYKLTRSDSIVRRLIGTAYNVLIHTSHHLPISDVDCDFRLIRRALLHRIDLKANSGTICLELVTKLEKAGAKFTEVGVHHYPRPFGKSQFFNLRHLLTTLKELISFS